MAKHVFILFSILIMSQLALAEAKRTFSSIADENMAKYDQRNPPTSRVYSGNTHSSQEASEYKAHDKADDNSLSSFYRPNNQKPEVEEEKDHAKSGNKPEPIAKEKKDLASTVPVNK